MKRLLITFIFTLIFYESCFANFKQIKRKASVNKPEVIFPTPQKLNRCQTKLYVSPEMYKVKPVLKVSAPKGYGLDDRFDYALSRFSNFSFPCSGGDPTSCKFVKKIILEWAKSDAAKELDHQMVKEGIGTIH